MASRGGLSKLVQTAQRRQPVNKVFLQDLMTAIEVIDAEDRHAPSVWYKPSSMTCLRNMYFTRTGAPRDTTRTEYQGVGMADTGTRRHTAIQTALARMESLGYDWKYVDVEEYLDMKRKEGKCLDIEVKGKRGAETHLFNSALKISFMCDGVVQQISSGEYFLFEFKNQISFKFNSKEGVDAEHIPQISVYALCLDLVNVFVVYENRDNCQLDCFETFTVTDDLKREQVDKLLECESYVERLIPPPKHKDAKACRWCPYLTECRKAGN